MKCVILNVIMSGTIFLSENLCWIPQISLSHTAAHSRQDYNTYAY